MSDSPSDTEPATGLPSPIDEAANWLIDQALGDTSLEDLFQGCCERLIQAGIPISRGYVTFRILHPLYFSMGLTWVTGEPLLHENYGHEPRGPLSDDFKRSPFYRMIMGNEHTLRRRLVGDQAELDFPVLAEFRDAGGTDYLGFAIRFGGNEFDGMAGSWLTDRPSGFSQSDIQSLLRIQQRLGVACKMRIREQIARNVVTTYLGTLAGQRVLDGQIQRGDGEAMSAVIWYSDLRGSTVMADTLPSDEFVQALNDYFECAAGAVQAEGGEILAFIGDAVLAIFPLDDAPDGAARACARALSASKGARERLVAVNARRSGRPLSFSMALHLGEVRFGNIGVPERVSFSVVGPTVNEVARLEALTKELDQPVLASAAFVQHSGNGWQSLGEFTLRGVGKPIEVFAPAEG